MNRNAEHNAKLFLCEHQMDDKQTNNTAIKLIASKVINMVVSEMNKSDIQEVIRRKIITPVINMIYAELYPYIIALIISICVILLLSFMTFIFFVLYYFKK